MLFRSAFAYLSWSLRSAKEELQFVREEAFLVDTLKMNGSP